MMKNLIVTTSFLVVVSLLAGTDFCPCCTHAATLFNHDEETLLNIAEKFELSRQKRQTGIIPINTNTGYDVRRSRVSPVPFAPFTAEYLEKSRMIFHAHQILYGPLWELHAQFPNNNRDDSLDLGRVLNYLKNPRNLNVNQLPQNLKTNFPGFERFQQMYHMRNEVSHQSYSVSCFDSDRTVLIAVAKYLDGVKSGTTGGTVGSWQRGTITASPAIRNRQTLELAIALALGYRGSQGGSSSFNTNSNNQCSRPASVTTGSGGSQSFNSRRNLGSAG